MKSKKKVLFLIPTLGGGGAERVLVNLVNGMNLGKYEITIQSIFKAGVNSDFVNPHITLKQGKIKQFRGSSFLLSLLPSKLAYKYVVKDHYDIAVSYLEGPSSRIISGCPFDDSKKVGWIHCVHKNSEEVYHSFISKKDAEKCYYAFDAMAYVSQRVKNDFLQYFPSLKRNEVIHNTNDDSKILSMANEEVSDVIFSNTVNVVSVGRLIPVKGYERLIDAHARLIKEGVMHHVYIIGAGGMEINLRQQIKALEVESTFHLVGFQKNPYKYVNKADLFICSSYSEGFSTAVTEALILGKPVISTDVSGAKEMLGDNNEYGVVVENSTDGIYEGLKEMLQSTEKLNYYTRQAELRGLVFSKANAIQEVEHLLDTL